MRSRATVALALALACCESAPSRPPSATPTPTAELPPPVPMEAAAPPTASAPASAAPDATAPEAAPSPDAGQATTVAPDLLAGCHEDDAPQQPPGPHTTEVRVDVRYATPAERKEPGNEYVTVVAAISVPSLRKKWIVFGDTEPAGCGAFTRGDRCLSFQCFGDMQHLTTLLSVVDGELVTRSQSFQEGPLIAVPAPADGGAPQPATPNAFAPEQRHGVKLPPGAKLRFKVKIDRGLLQYSSAPPTGW